jgi:biofilm PGA synthesis N-glycosyltransferase PgaC
MTFNYVLLTAAKDEAELIGEVIERVASQTALPSLWVIVDDGSTDRTAEIVREYAARHHWIRLSSSGERNGRNFGSQYKALQAGYESVRELAFDFVAVQDADQAPASADYYEGLMRRFDRDPSLGMASGMVYERSRGVWRYRSSNSADATAGSVVFRRPCFEGIGGYMPLKHGGSDWLAQIDARMAGWSVSTESDLHLLHYRPTSSAGGLWRGRFREGLMDASFGTHPAFEFLKCCRRAMARPLLLGAVVRFGGYLSWHLAGRAPVIPPNKVAFLRREQLARLRLRHRHVPPIDPRPTR